MLPPLALRGLGGLLLLKCPSGWVGGFRWLVWGACDPNGPPAPWGKTTDPDGGACTCATRCAPPGDLVRQGAVMQGSAGTGWAGSKRTRAPAARLPVAVTSCAGRACTWMPDARPDRGHFADCHPRTKRPRQHGALTCQVARWKSTRCCASAGTRFGHGTGQRRQHLALRSMGGTRPPRTAGNGHRQRHEGIPPTGVFRWELWFQRLFYYTSVHTTPEAASEARGCTAGRVFTNVNGLFTELRT